MSRSIKYYKDAMDSVKISDSFYKRTEALLNDLSDDDSEKKPFHFSGRVTGGIMAAAACIVCIIGGKLVLDEREDNISSVSETSLTSITTEITTEIRSAPELIDRFSEDDSFAGLDEEYEEAVPELENEEAAHDAAGYDPPASSASDDNEEPDGGVAMYIGADENAFSFAIPEADPVYDNNDEKSGYPDINVKGTENIPEIADIAPENVTGEVTPYFDMGEITSGGSRTFSGEEIADIIEIVKSIPAGSRIVPNEGFVSVFMLQLSDKETGDIFYSIYLTDAQSLVIAKHSSPQERTTYMLSDEDYDLINRSLFRLLGDGSDYTLFEDLISGE